MHINRENFKNEEKKIKRHYEQQIILKKILILIKQCQSYEELVNNGLLKIYGFERLKHELSEYYSFNLCKNKGTIRLICTIDEESNTVNLEFISLNHYDDFKKSLR